MQGVNEVNQKLRLMIDERWYVWQGNKENILRAISRNQHDAKSVENYFVYQNGVAFRKNDFLPNCFYCSFIYHLSARRKYFERYFDRFFSNSRAKIGQNGVSKLLSSYHAVVVFVIIFRNWLRIRNTFFFSYFIIQTNVQTKRQIWFSRLNFSWRRAQSRDRFNFAFDYLGGGVNVELSLSWSEQRRKVWRFTETFCHEIRCFFENANLAPLKSGTKMRNYI